MEEQQTDEGKPQTISTWDAPWAGTILAPPGIATRVLIPIPRTQNSKLPNGLVLSLRPPPEYGSTTSALFMRNPDDLRQGRPGLRLDYGRIGKNGPRDYHWNIEGGGPARQRFQNLTNHQVVGRGGAVVYEVARAFRVAGRVFIISGAIADSASIVMATHPMERSIEVITAWSLASAGAMSLGSFGAEIGTGMEPGFGTAIGGGIGALLGSITGYWAGETGVRYLYQWPRNTIFKPFPQVPVPK